ncbi:hypothetical protein GPECTOR_4g1013 [Gonium pectorale]|uniref:XPG-I domain-containing protein n=1 Tax=Gonium pectorale TaxID=33097 RepID=A0A150GXP4_GONPE|nr:hypothetical protein GPECTOR_4g1013 [Gonium pectorale]|eukprot:KXZ54462.1 hypothetical protein GPECTOR_4g1013 [Gonium pectorale]
MGVINLWTELAKYDQVYRTWSGGPASAGGGTRGIVAELSGKVLAIDTSVWIFQCSQQNDLKEAIFNEQARVLYTFHHRIVSLLRYGVTPVFVLEGDTPEAKMGRLNQRSLAKGLGGLASGNRKGGRHDSLGRKVVELLDELGVPHVDAPGEAEAMCAALVACGLASGAVTSDVDALLFGAGAVYRECRLSFDQPKMNELERVDAREAARRCFGLRGGGGCTLALRAVACLCGCDYSVNGGKGVGVKTAMDAIQLLTVGEEDDSHVIPALLRYLREGPDPRVTALKSCTGCKTCGHEKHGRQPCPECGPGPCRPKAEAAGCGCAFHRSEPQRKFMRVIARAVGTSQSFAAECSEALQAFESEAQRARTAAEALKRRIGAFSWSRRPDVRGVYSLLHPLLGSTSSDPDKLLWTYGEVRDKLRPLLMEWDMRQGPDPHASVRGLLEFRPRRIKQVASKDGEDWAYLIEFDRLPGVNTPDLEFDVAQLSNSKLVKARHVRQCLVEQAWPQLLVLREEEEQAKLDKPKRSRKKGAAADSQSPGGASGPMSNATTGFTAGAAGGASAGVGGGRGRGRAKAAAASVISDASAGSRDVMMRFLHKAPGAGAGGGPGPASGRGGLDTVTECTDPSSSVQLASPPARPREGGAYNPYMGQGGARSSHQRPEAGMGCAAAAAAGSGGGSGLYGRGPGPAAGLGAAAHSNYNGMYADATDVEARLPARTRVGHDGTEEEEEEENAAATAALVAAADAAEAAAAAARTKGVGARRSRLPGEAGADTEDDVQPMSLDQRLGAAQARRLAGVAATVRQRPRLEGGGDNSAGRRAAVHPAEDGPEDVDVFDLTQLEDTPQQQPRTAPRRRSGDTGRRLGFEAAEPGQVDAGEHQDPESPPRKRDDAVGSAVKPSARARACGDGAAPEGTAGRAASAIADGERDDGGGAAAASGHAGHADVPPSRPPTAARGAGTPGTAGKEAASARRAQLMRSLFPDRESAEATGHAAAAAAVDGGRSGAGSGGAGPSTRAGSVGQQKQHSERRPDMGVEGSPPKRRNTGDGSGSSGGGDRSGGEGGAGVGTGWHGATAAAAAAEAVDLTLTDSDPEDDSGGNVRSGDGGGGRTVPSQRGGGAARRQVLGGRSASALPVHAPCGGAGAATGAVQAVDEDDDDDDDVVILS